MLGVLLAFRWSEREPAHFDQCLAAKCQPRSRILLGEVVILLVELDGDSQTEKSWVRNLKVVVVGRHMDMDCESVIRNGASRGAEKNERDEILKQRLSLP